MDVARLLEQGGIVGQDCKTYYDLVYDYKMGDFNNESRADLGSICDGGLVMVWLVLEHWLAVGVVFVETNDPKNGCHHSCGGGIAIARLTVSSK